MESCGVLPMPGAPAAIRVPVLIWNGSLYFAIPVQGVSQLSYEINGESRNAARMGFDPVLGSVFLGSVAAVEAAATGGDFRTIVRNAGVGETEYSRVLESVAPVAISVPTAR